MLQKRSYERSGVTTFFHLYGGRYVGCRATEFELAPPNHMRLAAHRKLLLVPRTNQPETCSCRVDKPSASGRSSRFMMVKRPLDGEYRVNDFRTVSKGKEVFLTGANSMVARAGMCDFWADPAMRLPFCTLEVGRAAVGQGFLAAISCKIDACPGRQFHRHPVVNFEGFEKPLKFLRTRLTGRDADAVLIRVYREFLPTCSSSHRFVAVGGLAADLYKHDHTVTLAADVATDDERVLLPVLNPVLKEALTETDGPVTYLFCACGRRRNQGCECNCANFLEFKVFDLNAQLIPQHWYFCAEER